MKKILFLIAFCFIIFGQSQMINLKSYIKSKNSDPFKKVPDEIRKDFSSNILDFGKIKNDQIRKKIQSSKNANQSPKIRD